MDEADPRVQLLLDLETCFTEPDFFISTEAVISQAESQASVGEQSLASHSLWLRFTSIVEGRLKAFLEGRNASEVEVYEACKLIYDQDPNALTCFEYIFAAADYEDFLELLLSRKRLQDWQGEESSPSP